MLTRTNNTITVASIQTTMDVVLYSLSDSSKRQYEHTYKLWNTFCERNGYKASEIEVNHVIDFLEDGNLSHRTKQNRLSHLRKLIEAIHVQHPHNEHAERLYGQLKLLKIQSTKSDKQARRDKTTMTKQHIYEAFKLFAGDSPVNIRNRAMLSVLLYAGLRRNELVNLQWTDIDLIQGHITVEHGKGTDEAKTIPILGGLEHIQAWYDLAGDRTFVFCGMAKGDKFASDKPMSTNAVYKVVKHIENELNIDKLSPHDFRRTMIKGMIESGTPLNVAQSQARHKRSETTMLYAQGHSAESIKAQAKLPY